MSLYLRIAYEKLRAMNYDNSNKKVVGDSLTFGSGGGNIRVYDEFSFVAEYRYKTVWFGLPTKYAENTVYSVSHSPSDKSHTLRLIFFPKMHRQIM